MSSGCQLSSRARLRSVASTSTRARASYMSRWVARPRRSGRAVSSSAVPIPPTELTLPSSVAALRRRRGLLPRVVRDVPDRAGSRRRWRTRARSGSLLRVSPARESGRVSTRPRGRAAACFAGAGVRLDGSTAVPAADCLGASGEVRTTRLRSVRLASDRVASASASSFPASPGPGAFGHERPGAELIRHRRSSSTRGCSRPIGEPLARSGPSSHIATRITSARARCYKPDAL